MHGGWVERGDFACRLPYKRALVCMQLALLLLRHLGRRRSATAGGTGHAPLERI